MKSAGLFMLIQIIGIYRLVPTGIMRQVSHTSGWKRRIILLQELL